MYLSLSCSPSRIAERYDSSGPLGRTGRCADPGRCAGLVMTSGRGQSHSHGQYPPVTAHCITSATIVAAGFAETARSYADRPFLRVLPETARAYGIVPRAITYGDAATDVAR